MTPQSLMKRRVNTSFLMMLLTLAVQSVVSIPIVVFTALSMLGIEVSSYYTEFVLVQLLYPLGTCVLALFVLRMISIPRSSVVTIKPLRGDFIPWLGFFLGVTVVMNYTVTLLMEVLEWIGISIPDAFSSYDPQTLPQAVCYFVVLAILPPVCEEILCRASVAGVLKHLHPWTAVTLSAYAFAMMHATVQQIPFALALGVVLGFVYVKTGNLLYPILLHFANNAFACLMTYLSVWGEEWVVNVVGYGADLLFLLFGVASAIWLMVKKRFTLKEIPHSLSAADSAMAVIKAPCFWIFSGVYAGLTLANSALLLFQESQGIPL